MSASGNDLLQDILGEFSKDLHSALPLRNFGEFHDGPTLNFKAEKMGKRTMKKFSLKQTNFDAIETSLLYKDLGERIKDIISKHAYKNQKHRARSELFLGKRVDVLFEDLNASLENKLSVEPDMDLEELEAFIENRKEKIVGIYDEFFKPGDATFQGKYKTMLEKKLDALQNEFLEGQSAHLGWKLAEKARMSFEEMETIVLIMFRQLRRKVKSHQGPVPTQLLQERAKGILEYLEGQGDTLALDEHHQIMYCELWGTLSGAISYLDQLMKEYLTPAEAMEWVETLDQQLNAKCEFQEDADGKAEVQQTSNDATEEIEVELQEISNNDAENAEEVVHLMDSGSEEDCIPKNVPVDVVEVLGEDIGIGDIGGSFENVEGLQVSNDELHRSEELVAMESGPRVDIGIVDLEEMDGPTQAPESISEDTFNEVDIDVETGEDGEPVCSLRIVQIQGGARMEPQPSSSSNKSSQLSPVCPAKIAIVQRKNCLLYYCKVCKCRFKRKANLKRHGDFCSSHKSFMCPKCDKGFFRKNDFDYHIQTHEGEVEKPYKCNKCRKQFATRMNMQKHLRFHGSGLYFCKECNVSFGAPKELHDHNSLNHKNKLPFACSYCSSRFRDMDCLKAHVITHSGERPFTCPICKSPFAKKVALVEHIRNVHRQSNEVANQLAKEAAMEYFRKNVPDISNGNSAPPYRIHSVVLSLAIKKANLTISQQPTKLSN